MHDLGVIFVYVPYKQPCANTIFQQAPSTMFKSDSRIRHHVMDGSARIEVRACAARLEYMRPAESLHHVSAIRITPRHGILYHPYPKGDFGAVKRGLFHDGRGAFLHVGQQCLLVGRVAQKPAQKHRIHPVTQRVFKFGVLSFNFRELSFESE